MPLPELREIVQVKNANSEFAYPSASLKLIKFDRLWELGANKTPEGIPVGVAVHALGDNSDEEEEEETPAKSSNRRASGASSTQNGNRRKSTQMTQDDEDEDLSPDTRESS